MHIVQWEYQITQNKKYIVWMKLPPTCCWNNTFVFPSCYQPSKIPENSLAFTLKSHCSRRKLKRGKAWLCKIILGQLRDTGICWDMLSHLWENFWITLDNLWKNFWYFWRQFWENFEFGDHLVLVEPTCGQYMTFFSERLTKQQAIVKGSVTLCLTIPSFYQFFPKLNLPCDCS